MMGCFDEESIMWWPFNVGGPLGPKKEKPPQEPEPPMRYIEQEAKPKKKKKKGWPMGQAQRPEDLGELKLGKGGVLGYENYEKARKLFG